MNRSNWEGINFPSEKNVEKNSLNVVYAKKEKLYLVYVSKITQTVKSKLLF